LIADFGRSSSRRSPSPASAETSRAHALIALGASVGANSHPLLQRHIVATLELGLRPAEIAAAARMAEYVQRRAGEMTAEKATHTLDELSGVGGGGQNVTAQRRRLRRPHGNHQSPKA